MNKDIEELRVRLNKTLENYELDKKFGQMSIDSIYSMFPSEIEKLLNYIDKLESCYCNRTDCSARIKDSKKYDSVQQRIDKAIEFIEKRMIVEQFFNLDIKQCGELLEILRGEENE